MCVCVCVFVCVCVCGHAADAHPPTPHSCSKKEGWSTFGGRQSTLLGSHSVCSCKESISIYIFIFLYVYILSTPYANKNLYLDTLMDNAVVVAVVFVVAVAVAVAVFVFVVVVGRHACIQETQCIRRGGKQQ